jgi:hypothetical protein
MRRRPRNRHLRSNTLAARIDHAAEEINPFLAVIAVGLVVLDLVALAFLAPRLSFGRDDAGAAVKAVLGPRLSGPGGAQ